MKSLQLNNSKHIVAALAFTSALTSSANERAILESAAAKIEELEKRSTTTTTTSDAANVLNDRAIRTIDHCLGLYVQEEAVGCGHFDGDPEGAPTEEDVDHLALLIRNSKVSTTTNVQALLADAVREGIGADSNAGFGLHITYEDGPSVEAVPETEVAEPAEAVAGFFSGAARSPVTGTAQPSRTYAQEMQENINTLNEAIADGGPEASKVGVARDYLQRMIAKRGADPQEIIQKMKDVHSRLGDRINSSNLSPSDAEAMKGFHNFLGDVIGVNSGSLAA
jgi:hypothetical protein